MKYPRSLFHFSLIVLLIHRAGAISIPCAVDLAFVVDSSINICKNDPFFVHVRDTTCAGWRKIIDFMYNFVDGMNIGPLDNQVGLVTFHTIAQVVWNLNRYNDKTSLLPAIRNLPYGYPSDGKGEVALRSALDRLRTEVFTGPGDRPNAPNFAILIRGEKPSACDEEELGKLDNVGVISITVLQTVNQTTCQRNGNGFLCPNFDSIGGLLQMIYGILCFGGTTDIITQTPPTSATSQNNCMWDIVFVIDNSASICGPSNQFRSCDKWNKLKKFIKDIVLIINIGPSDDVVGLVMYGNNAAVAWTLDSHTDKNSLMAAIDVLEYRGGVTNITGGLRLMRTQVFSTYGDRLGAPNLALVITDELPTTNRDWIQNEVNRVFADNIDVVSFGIAYNSGDPLLASISSAPHQVNQNYFIIPELQNSETAIAKLREKLLCLGATTVTPPPSSPIAEYNLTTATVKPYTIATTGPGVEIGDLVLVIDNSGSICDSDPTYTYGIDNTCTNWQQIVNFTKNVINDLIIGPTAIMVGVVFFHNSAEVVFDLTQYTDKFSLLNAIGLLPYIGGFTDTADGLKKMRSEVFTKPGDRPYAPNVAVVITDGKPTRNVEQLPAEINAVEGAGISVIAIGITNSVNESTLQQISSSPHTVNMSYFMCPTYESIRTIREAVTIEMRKLFIGG